MLALALLAACAPTNGESGKFNPLKTTNEDFDVEFVDVGIFPIVIGVADIDGNGEVDAAVSNRFDNTVTILTNGLTQSETLDVGTSPTDAVFGDFNGDAFLDLALLDSNNTRLSIYKAKSGGGWKTPKHFDLEGVATQLSLIDLNGSGGVKDLVVSVSALDQVWAFKNDGSGNFTPHKNSGNSGAAQFVIGDWNGDGDPDLAVLNPPADVMTPLIGNGTGSFTRVPAEGIDTRNNPTRIVTADFNGDGDADLAVVSRSESRISIYLGDGSGGFALLDNIKERNAPESLIVAALDTDSSGDANDLAVVHRGHRAISLQYWNAGENFFDKDVTKVDEDPFSIASGDFNLDGCTDLITTESVRRDLSVLAGDCHGGFDRTIIGFEGKVSYPVVTDLDNDGADDVLLVQSQSQRLVVLRNRH